MVVNFEILEKNKGSNYEQNKELVKFAIEKYYKEVTILRKFVHLNIHAVNFLIKNYKMVQEDI